MSAAFLCVQFRNVLPSEELLLSARALWNDLQRQASYTADGDATLSIRQTIEDDGRFEVALTVPGAVLSVSALDADALAGIARVFRLVAAAHDDVTVSQQRGELSTVAALGKSATSRRDESAPDTGTND